MIKRSMASASASAAALSEDLLAEILLKLPLKSLARFTCVCKSWRAIISGDYLRSRLPLAVAGVFFHGDPRRPSFARAVDGQLKFQEIDLGFFPFEQTATIIDGCNGLLLYYSSAASLFYVVNPIAGRWVAVPAPEKKKPLLSILAFDPCSSPQFTIVCFTSWSARGAGVEVFSSGSGEWAAGGVEFGVDTDTVSTKMHCFNGALYVLSFAGVVVRVELGTMSATAIPLPAPVSVMACAGHCRGQLRYCRSDGDGIKIWELGTKGGKWTLVHAVEGLGEASSPAQLLGIHPVEEVVYLWTDGRLLCFDVKERRIEREWRFAGEEDGEKPYPVQLSAFPLSLSPAPVTEVENC